MRRRCKVNEIRAILTFNINIKKLKIGERKERFLSKKCFFNKILQRIYYWVQEGKTPCIRTYYIVFCFLPIVNPKTYNSESVSITYNFILHCKETP